MAAPTTPEWIDLPGDTFWMGGGPKANENPASPGHGFTLPAGARRRSPGGNTRLFLDVTGHPAPDFWNAPEFAGPTMPAVGPSWDDAGRYCAWLNEQLAGKRRGCPPRRSGNSPPPDGREVLYPWGDDPPEALPDYAQRWHAGPEPVDAYPFAASREASWGWARTSTSGARTGTTPATTRPRRGTRPARPGERPPAGLARRRVAPRGQSQPLRRAFFDSAGHALQRLRLPPGVVAIREKKGFAARRVVECHPPTKIGHSCRRMMPWKNPENIATDLMVIQAGRPRRLQLREDEQVDALPLGSRAWWGSTPSSPKSGARTPRPRRDGQDLPRRVRPRRLPARGPRARHEQRRDADRAAGSAARHPQHRRGAAAGGCDLDSGAGRLEKTPEPSPDNSRRLGPRLGCAKRSASWKGGAGPRKTIRRIGFLGALGDGGATREAGIVPGPGRRAHRATSATACQTSAKRR